ncbi:retrotransposon Gag-like protein 3 [Ochotona princeps]|uniref:retrotransposon Gag-like protein 3 n=1 Tax=Ochotona princeps TaxID=9978 RepID=UPI002714FB17|nr:retrotransposon Gag-like protein 3 [Ochotona princeps]
MVEDLAASYIALKLENEILQAQVQRLMEENAALQAQIPESQKSRAAKEDEQLPKPSPAQESREPPEPSDPSAAREPQELPEIQEPPELLAPSAARELPKPSEIEESWEPPEPLGAPAAWEPEDSPENQESQELPEFPERPAAWEPPEPQQLSAREPAAVQELHESQKLLESPAVPESLESAATWDLQQPPAARELATACEIQEPRATQDTSAAQEPQDPESQDPEPQEPPDAEESQEAPECQETLAQLESPELPSPQEILEPWVPQEPLDPTEFQESLEFSASAQSLEGLIRMETPAASGFSQASTGLEVATVPLEYPLAFSGDAQKLPEFLIQLSAYVRVRGHLYPTEAALVSFVGNCFSGDAGRWFRPFLDIQSPLLEQFESFLQVLQDAFDNPENMEDINHFIRQLCQGEDPVHRAATHFCVISRELSGDESTLSIRFQESLLSSIRDEVSRRNSAAGMSDLVIRYISTEEKLSGKPDLNPSGQSSSDEGDRPELPLPANQAGQAASNRPHLSEAERARRREGHLCLYCGHPGHFARDCPVKPHRAQQAGNIEARR